MWVREIVRARRRRRFIRRARNIVNSIISGIRGRVSESIDWNQMEKIITAAILVGLKRYADAHPNLRQHVSHIMDVANGDKEIDLMVADKEVSVIKKRSGNRKTKK